MFRLIKSFFYAGLICLLMIPLPSKADDTMGTRIKSIMDQPRYAQSHWGILVADLDSGGVLYEFSADKLFTPASTTKLFTMAAGLNALGADYRFKTPIYRRGAVNKRGELKGDLILVASGDLTLGGRTDAKGRIAFTNMDHTDAGDDGPLAAELTSQDPLAGVNNLARQVAASGIKRVRGDVIIDDRLFEKSKSPEGFVRTPISVNDNVIDFVITPTVPGKAALVDWRPQTSFYQVESQVMTVDPKKESQIEVISGGKNRLIVMGIKAAGQKPSIRIYHVEDPSSFARALLIEALRGAGVRVDAPLPGRNPAGKLPDNKEYASMTRIALLESPPYSETIKLVLKVSLNPGAEMTPLIVAARNGKRTTGEGLALERAFLEGAGVDVRTISIADGQGADRSDLITPRAAVQLLRGMAARPDYQAYRDALPILGVDGTLAHSIPPESPARGKVFAKTGTLVTGDLLNDRGVLTAKGLAGYINASSGRKLVFAFYVSNVFLSDMNDVVAVGSDLGKLAETVYLAQ